MDKIHISVDLDYDRETHKNDVHLVNKGERALFPVAMAMLYLEAGKSQVERAALLALTVEHLNSLEKTEMTAIEIAAIKRQRGGGNG